MKTQTQQLKERHERLTQTLDFLISFEHEALDYCDTIDDEPLNNFLDIEVIRIKQQMSRIENILK